MGISINLILYMNRVDNSTSIDGLSTIRSIYNSKVCMKHNFNCKLIDNLSKIRYKICERKNRKFKSMLRMSIKNDYSNKSFDIEDSKSNETSLLQKYNLKRKSNVSQEIPQNQKLSQKLYKEIMYSIKITKKNKYLNNFRDKNLSKAKCNIILEKTSIKNLIKKSLNELETSLKLPKLTNSIDLSSIGNTSDNYRKHRLPSFNNVSNSKLRLLKKFMMNKKQSTYKNCIVNEQNIDESRSNYYEILPNYTKKNYRRIVFHKMPFSLL